MTDESANRYSAMAVAGCRLLSHFFVFDRNKRVAIPFVIDAQESPPGYPLFALCRLLVPSKMGRQKCFEPGEQGRTIVYA